MPEINTKIILIFLILSAVLFSQNRVALVLDVELEQQNNKVNQDLINDITAFEIFLMQNKIDYSVINTDELNNRVLQEFDALIFPTSTNLNEENFYLIEEALKKGTGIISFGNIIVYDGKDSSNVCSKLYGVESLRKDELDNFNFIQQFSFKQGLLNYSNDFELLINSFGLKHLYKINHREIYSFGCYNNQNEFTTSFYGFKSSGRFAHFGFSFSKILSDKKAIKEFENLLLYIFRWIQKDSGIWLTKSENNKKHFLFLLDLTRGSFINETIIKKFTDQNYPVVLMSDSPDKIRASFYPFRDEISLALKFNCDNNIDSLIKNISASKLKIDYLVVENNCLDERQIRQLSFSGIKTILSRNSKESYLSSIYDIISIPYAAFNSNTCTQDILITALYPEKINCDEQAIDKFFNKVSEVKDDIKPFNRDELISELLIKQLKILTSERNGEFIIDIKNESEVELKDFLLIIDSKKLLDKIIYDIRINGKSRFVQKDILTGYYIINFNSIEPKSNIKVNILFDENI